LAGDIIEGLVKKGIDVIPIVPFYKQHWRTKEQIDYNPDDCFKVSLFNEELELSVRRVKRAGADVYGIASDDFDELYTSCRRKRLRQEVLLGHAVPAILKKLNIIPDLVWLQEGHCSIVIPVMKEMPEYSNCKYHFTTHTSVPEGLEKFDSCHFNGLKIHDKYWWSFFHYEKLDMTRAAMSLSDQINSVSEIHCEKTKEMFPEHAHKIVDITNGSSIELWQSPNIKKLNGNGNGLSLWEAHRKDKENFINLIKNKTGVFFDINYLCMAWVRRFAPYKNQMPMLEPIVEAMCAEKGEKVYHPEFGFLEGLGYRIFGASTAHELDHTCQGWIREMKNWNEKYKGKFIFLEDYSFELRQIACQGSDVWFSSPIPGHEACGTSDQCAMINGVLNLCTRDGGAAEKVRELNLVNGDGNGLFIVPYSPIGLYFKAKILSDLYYGWTINSNPQWLKFKTNALETGKELDVPFMIQKYDELFKKMIL
jgi:glucan phosphorylase